MLNEIKEEDEDVVKLYPSVDKDGATKVPNSLAVLMQDLDVLVERKEMSAVDQAIYDTIVDIMVTPVVNLQEKFEELLDELYMNVIEQSIEENNMAKKKSNHQNTVLTPAKEPEKKPEAVAVVQPEKADILEYAKELEKYGGQPFLAPTSEADGVPTELELNRWYQAATGVIIEGWHSSSYTYKIKEYLTYLSVRASQTEDDISDEELDAEFAAA